MGARIQREFFFELAFPVQNLKVVGQADHSDVVHVWGELGQQVPVAQLGWSDIKDLVSLFYLLVQLGHHSC